ncbi:MAG TPA: hypothetical protein VJP81_04650 [Candidatus Dormibacteraeota bacterium]|nr:hypothetical protein [Candidatus Dormibacteraeota bacterium]
MAEIEVWIISRSADQLETAAAAFARVADEPDRFGLVRVEGLKSDDGAVVGRVFMRDESSCNLPRAAVWQALSELANRTFPIGEQQIVCFPLH